MPKKKVFAFIFLLVTGGLVKAQELQWTEIARGVWKGIAGKPEAYDLLKASGATPNMEALAKMGAVLFPLSKEDIAVSLNDGKTNLRFPLEKEEQLFGFGLNFQTIHQRGKILQLHMDHYGGRDNGRTHAPVMAQKKRIQAFHHQRPVDQRKHQQGHTGR